VIHGKCLRNRCGRNALSATVEEKRVLSAEVLVKFTQDGKPAIIAMGLGAYCAQAVAVAVASMKVLGSKID